MPDIWAHILFGEEVISEMKDKELRLIKEWPTLFRFACQGPDFLFYYRFWPWQDSKDVNIIGSKIHKNSEDNFVLRGIKYVKFLHTQGLRGFPQLVDKPGDNMVIDEDDQKLLVYLIGLICHYALDVATHPFIHYNCGIYRKTGPSTACYRGNHKYFELLIDLILLQEKRQLPAGSEPVDQQINLGVELPNSVIKFYQQLVNSLFQCHLSKVELNTAYQDMLKAWQIFYDPHRIKVSFIKFVNMLTFGKFKYYHYFYPHTVDNSVDYLNRSHKKWCHPADETETYTASFEQLWEHGKGRAKEWIKVMFQYLKDEIGDQQLARLIPTLSFSSGKEPGEGDEEIMQYFSPIISLK